MYKIFNPLKDLLIALSFVYLYYYQGMKMMRKEKLASQSAKIDLEAEE
jgi:hypothetical protein